MIIALKFILRRLKIIESGGWLQVTVKWTHTSTALVAVTTTSVPFKTAVAELGSTVTLGMAP
jgi:hypothetical protein